MKMKYLITTAALLGLSCLIQTAQISTSVFAQDNAEESGNTSKVKQPVELGQVAWGRDLEAAVAESKKQNKPIALLFQEVPG